MPQGAVRLRQGQALVHDAAGQPVLGGVVTSSGGGGPGVGHPRTAARRTGPRPPGTGQGRRGSGRSCGTGLRAIAAAPARPLPPVEGLRPVENRREVPDGRLAPVLTVLRHVPDDPGRLRAVLGGMHLDAQHGDGLARVRQPQRGVEVDDRNSGGEPAQVRVLEALHVRGGNRDALLAPQDPAQDLAGQRVQRHEVENAVGPGEGVAVSGVADRAGSGAAGAPGREPLDPGQVDGGRDEGGAVLPPLDADPRAQTGQDPHLAAAPLSRRQGHTRVHAAAQDAPYAGGQRLQGDASVVVVEVAVRVHGGQVRQALQGLGSDLPRQVAVEDGAPGDALLDPPALARDQGKQTQSAGPVRTGVLRGDLDGDRAPRRPPGAQHVDQAALPVRVPRRGAGGVGPLPGRQDQGRRVLAVAPHGARAASPPGNALPHRLGEDQGLVDLAP